MNNRDQVGIAAEVLCDLYAIQGMSMQAIARHLGCSQNHVVYWMTQHGIARRSWSEATYTKRNPVGDPFMIRMPETPEEREFFAFVIGLYLGEGAKKGRFQVVVVNTGPAILCAFMQFLDVFCGIPRVKLQYWLNIFDDVDSTIALEWWCDQLGVEASQLYRTTVRTARGGTYNERSQYGTVSVMFHNIKLKLFFDEWCEKYRKRFTAKS